MITLDHAIEVMENLVVFNSPWPHQESRDAGKLAIEAMKALQGLRMRHLTTAFSQLEGETPE